MAGTNLEKRSPSAKLLLANAHLSPNELGAATGFPAVEAAQRLMDLLDDRDYLTMRYQERLLVIEMQDLVRDARRRLEDADDDHYASIANVAIRGMKEIGIRLDAIRRATEIDIQEITRAQAHVYGASMEAAIDHVMLSLQDAHPDITHAEVVAYAREGVLAAKKKLEESVGEE